MPKIKLNMEKSEFRTVIHLQIGEAHEYYGSQSSLYDKHTAYELGIAQASLNILYVKPTTRGRKKIE